MNDKKYVNSFHVLSYQLLLYSGQDPLPEKLGSMAVVPTLVN